MRILKLENVPIIEQLQIEEALLRADEQDWCLINSGTSPAIVMGISGKPEKLINLELVKRDEIPVIKRFSGGGTVYVDPNTVFVTFIQNGVRFPKAILEWTEEIYASFFPNFRLEENDYVFGEKKFGGNAQYIQKGRWLHHTSFLWDYEPEKMEYLLLPEKRPKYRGDRPHLDFLCKLRSLYPKKEELIERLCSHLADQLDAENTSLSEIQEILSRPHRKSSCLIQTI